VGGVNRHCPFFSVVQVQAERRGLAARLLERLAPHDGEAHAGHALEALVGGGHHRVEGDAPGVERDGAERAHRVDQEPPTPPRGHRRDLLDRIQHARRGLAVHHHHVGHHGIAGEGRVERGRIGRLVLGCLQRLAGAPVVLAHADHAPAVGAVDEHQELARGGHQGADHRLDDERPAALEGHAHVAAVARDQLEQAPAHPRVHGDELPVARAPVAQHRFLGRAGRGQRPRGQQKRLAVRPVHGARSFPVARLSP
jgi:hypothetical protein